MRSRDPPSSAGSGDAPTSCPAVGSEERTRRRAVAASPTTVRQPAGRGRSSVRPQAHGVRGCPGCRGRLGNAAPSCPGAVTPGRGRRRERVLAPCPEQSGCERSPRLAFSSREAPPSPARARPRTSSRLPPSRTRPRVGPGRSPRFPDPAAARRGRAARLLHAKCEKRFVYHVSLSLKKRSPGLHLPSAGLQTR